MTPKLIRSVLHIFLFCCAHFVIFISCDYEHGKTDHLQLAIISLKKAYKLEPHNPSICSELFKVYLLNDQPEKAIRLLTKSATDLPEAGWPEFYLGNYYLDNDQIELAVRNYELAVPKQPKYRWIYVNIATRYRKIGQYQKALNYARKIFDYPDVDDLYVKAQNEIDRIQRAMEKSIGIIISKEQPISIQKEDV